LFKNNGATSILAVKKNTAKQIKKIRPGMTPNDSKALEKGIKDWCDEN